MYDDYQQLHRRNPGRRPGGADPFRARIGLMVVGILLAVPVALIVRSGGSKTVHTAGLPGASAVLTVTETSGDDTGDIALDTGIDPVVTSGAAQAAPAAESPAAQAAPAPAPTVEESTTAAPSSAPKKRKQTTSTSVQAKAEAAPASEAPTTEAPTTVAATVADAPSCKRTYKIAAGDYWLGIAKHYDVSLKSLLAANDAGTGTALFAGDEICLPADAQTPAVRPTTTTDAPAATHATSAPTTAAPTTTRAPATSTPAASPPHNSYSRDEVMQIIRDVWPDDLEDKAILIATRESDLNPTVRNYCCFGLFQLYWEVHKSWMRQLGIQEAADLYDPKVNAYAAYVLYQRSGGWGPWGG